MTNIFSFLTRNKRSEVVNYFDYSAKTRKMILVEAVKRANEMQLSLVRDYKKRARFV